MNADPDTDPSKCSDSNLDRRSLHCKPDSIMSCWHPRPTDRFEDLHKMYVGMYRACDRT